MRRFEFGSRTRVTSETPHQTLGEEEIAEETGHQEVLAKQLLEHVEGKTAPGDGVRLRRENPIDFTQQALPVGVFSWDSVQQSLVNVPFKWENQLS